MRTVPTQLSQRVLAALRSPRARAVWRSRRAQLLCASFALVALFVLGWPSGPPKTPAEPVKNVQQRPEVGEPVRQSHDVYLGWAPRGEHRARLPRPAAEARRRRSAWFTPSGERPVEQALTAAAPAPPRSRFASSGGPEGAAVRGRGAELERPRFAATPVPLGSTPRRLAAAPVVPRAEPDSSQAGSEPRADAASARPVRSESAAPVAAAAPAREAAPTRFREAHDAPASDQTDLAPLVAAFERARENARFSVDAAPSAFASFSEKSTVVSAPDGSRGLQPAAREAVPDQPGASPSAAERSVAQAPEKPGASSPYVLDFAREVEDLIADLPGQRGLGQALQVAKAGKLGGSGVVPGDLIVGGLVSPGHSPGVIEVMGDFIQEPGAVLDIELAGTAANQYDRLLVEGTLVLQGTVNVLLIDDFKPSPGDHFDVLQAADIIADAATFNLPMLEYGAELTTALTSNATGSGLRIQAVGLGGSITAVPEPSTGLLFALGIAGIAFSSKRARVKRPS